MEIVESRNISKTEANNSFELTRLSSNEKVFYALLFGILLGLVNTGLLPHQFVFVCLVPLLLFVQSALSKTEALVIGLLFGIGYYLVTLRWLLDLYPLSWLELDSFLQIQIIGQMWLLEAVHQAVLFALFAVLAYSLPVRSGFLPALQRPFYPYLLSLPLIWLFLMWSLGQAHFFCAAPLTQLAYSQSRTTELIQIAQFFGVQSIDFVIVLVNCVIAQLVISTTRLVPQFFGKSKIFSANASAIIDFAFVFIFLAGIIVWGRSNYLSMNTNDIALSLSANQQWRPEVSIGVVQGNFLPSTKQFNAAEARQFYSKTVSDLGTIFAVLPEAQLAINQPLGYALNTDLNNIAKRDKKEIILPAVEPSESKFTSVVQLLNSDGRRKIYQRTSVMPLLPLLPANPIVYLFSPKIASYFNDNSANSENNFGPNNQLLKSNFGQIGVTLGADISRQEIISKQVQLGASLLVNMADLSWFRNSLLSENVLSAAIMRAVENKRYVVLCTNGGVSAIINPAGIVTSIAQVKSKGTLVDTIQFLTSKSLFTRMWWLWTPIYNM